MNLDLTDKIAIVTGSSRGLGLATARALVEEGCRVTVCARGEARLNEAAGELRRLAGAADRVLSVAADVSTADGVEALVRRTVEAFGGLDILVNNVGVARGAGIADPTHADWQEALDQPPFPAGRPSRRAAP